MEFVNWIFSFIGSAGFAEWIVLINGLLLAIIAISLKIPGEQPEKALQKLVDVISKFSKK
jgi:hypothetical protein